MGCEHVYGLIQSGGLGDYYKQQDRVGRPIGDGPFAANSFVLINQLQKEAETTEGVSHTSVGLQGLSCLGCVWLVEELAKRKKDVRSVHVALSSNRMSLSWKSGGMFDLAELARDLQGFGYMMTPRKLGGVSVSPLAVRLLLTFVFCLNGFFLSSVVGAGLLAQDLGQLFVLLVFACASFGLFIGGTLFLVPAWRALQLRKIHSDLLPAAGVLLLYTIACFSLFKGQVGSLSVCLFFAVLPTMVFARWLSETWTLRRSSS